MNAEEARRQQMRGQYLSRINTVIDYIERNRADEFTLDELAHAAGFSKFHFRRIFYSLMGRDPVSVHSAAAPPESGYLPDDRPSFEMYHNDPKSYPKGKCLVDICIAVKPM